MAPVVIPTVQYPDLTEQVTDTTRAVNHVTLSSVATSNSTVTSHTSGSETVTLPLTSLGPEIWAPSDDVDVYRLNTPLSVPEPSLEPVVPGDGHLLGSGSSTDDLGWIIPTAIVVIAAMVGIAFLCYFGIRALELRMLGWCYRNCPCCCKPGGQGRRLLGGERYDNLSEDGDTTRRKESVRLRDFRERSPSYGVARSTAKEYTPPANPFDDD